ncbi:HNH endonuclease [Cellulomonas sp. Sa3CUA2]|uniref:HNH endonuclease n=1 Tax=Cellulomonas avistercoris TaxID=2762242 RepID=A0ABR8QG66_9CELL|nr:HNH endonuclease signature motif containing protein [Cellulomonas avistercoris]MBD7919351.1 HNH endonuclease [Cellulomonas avistercoris]
MSTSTRRVRVARRRRRRLAQVENDLTAAQWQAMQAAWGGCAYCGAAGRALQRDCVLPVSRGGRYTVENVVPACGSCNASKCNAEVTTWLRRKKLDERAFLLRHAEVRAGLVLGSTDADLPVSGPAGPSRGPSAGAP